MPFNRSLEKRLPAAEVQRYLRSKGHAHPLHGVPGIWPSLASVSEVAAGKRRRIDVSAEQSIRGTSFTSLEAQVGARVKQPVSAHIRALVDGQQRVCLVDSGADVCIVPTSYIDISHLETTDRRLLAANSTNIVIDGEIRLPVVIGDHRSEVTFIASPNIDEVILGRDWLNDNDAVWHFRRAELFLAGSKHLLLTGKANVARCSRCILQSDTTVPPRSEAIIPTHIVFNSLKPVCVEETWATTPSEPVQGLRISRTIVDGHHGGALVRVCNVLDVPIHLPRGHFVSQLQTVNTVSLHQQTGPTNRAEKSATIIQEMCNKVDTSVPEEARKALVELMLSYNDVLSIDEFDLGRFGAVQHQIDTGNSKPFRQSLRPQARAHLPVIDKLIDEMQQQGVIEPCQSEWASNIVLVKKKDGSIRFCVDYRKLNDLTKKDAYPLPRIDSCLDRLAGSVWFSTFDLRSGFHQVEMDPRDVNKTTFVCHRGSFRFPRMPFGLCNAPATFQRLMDMVMTGLNFETCLIYLDDIIVFSQDLPTHLQRLESLLARLRTANLKLKPSKCTLLQRKVTFLGFTVSSEGLGTDPSKVSAVQNWPTPENLRQSRAFVGLCQYYRRFVPNFSAIAAPLNALTKKGARFDWTTGCNDAFNALKDALISAAVLALPTEDGGFVLDTDASDSGIGAVLSQIQDGVERPVCYASQGYSKHEKNYNVTRKELLAVVTFTKKFRQYLLGRPFVIRTDHAALQWLKRTPEPIGQQARWLEILEEFDYDIQHRPGRNHGNADALSRRPTRLQPAIVATARVGATTRPELQSVEHVSLVVPPATEASIERFDWPAIQQSDPDIRFVYDIVQKRLPRPTPESVTARSSDVKTLCSQLDRLVISPDGVLKRKWTRFRKEHLQIIVPYDFRSEIATDLHKGLNGGHFGTRRAHFQLQRRFYWPGWSRSVKIAQLQCQQCARHKRPQNSRQGQLQPMVVGEPWERLGVDITGPHPTSAKGNVYILTLIDHFTKWTEMFPMRNQEASTIARILVDRVFCVYGLPMQILTDRGQNFESELFQEICKRLSIDKIRTTAYKPSTNGNIERFHSTLNSLLAKWVADNKKNWDEQLPAVAFAYRTSVQETTGFTPFSLMFGREARIPADIVYGTPQDDTRFNSAVDFVAARQDKLREAFEVVRQHLGTSAVRRKAAYDMRTRPHSYNIGDWVWFLSPRHKMKRGRKWQSPYEGPFLVVKQLGPVNVEIQRSSRSHSSIVHIDKLKPCHTPGLHSWLNQGDDDQEPEPPAGSESERMATRESANPTPDGSNSDCSDNDEPVLRRPQRTVKKPARFRDG